MIGTIQEEIVTADEKVTMEDLNFTVDCIMQKASDAEGFLEDCWRTRHDIY